MAKCTDCEAPVSRGSARCVPCRQAADRARREKVCRGCGVGFQPKRWNRTTYCSRQCAFDHASALKLPKTLRQRPKARPTPEPTSCAVCQRPTTRRFVYCSHDCARVGEAWATRIVNAGRKMVLARDCSACGGTFVAGYGDKRRSFCSADCAARVNRRIAKARRRVRIGVQRERFDPLEIFDRDGWRCRHCHRETPKRMRGTNAQNAPELDHIVPLSKGGSHTRGNTQLLCRECNGHKGAGQLLHSFELSRPACRARAHTREIGISGGQR